MFKKSKTETFFFSRQKLEKNIIMGTVRQSLSRLYTQLLLSCLKPKVGNSTHSDGRNARESLSNVWLPNLLLFKIKKEINKFEESISTQSHLAYNVLNLTGNWECCFLKRRGETGLLRKKTSQRPTCGVAYGIHEPEPHWWGVGVGGECPHHCTQAFSRGTELFLPV